MSTGQNMAPTSYQPQPSFVQNPPPTSYQPQPISQPQLPSSNAHLANQYNPISAGQTPLPINQQQALSSNAQQPSSQQQAFSQYNPASNGQPTQSVASTNYQPQPTSTNYPADPFDFDALSKPSQQAMPKPIISQASSSPWHTSSINPLLMNRRQ
jgi:hypothetical protein